MHFKAPAPKRKHNLWQWHKSYPASVGFVGSVCALQRIRATTQAQPVAAQRKPSVLCCALRGCARIRQQILGIRCKCAESAPLFSETCCDVKSHSATYHGGRSRVMMHESVVEASAHCGEQKAFTCFGVAFLHMTQRSEAAQRIHLSSVACGIGALP